MKTKTTANYGRLAISIALLVAGSRGAYALDLEEREADETVSSDAVSGTTDDVEREPYYYRYYLRRLSSLRDHFEQIEDPNVRSELEAEFQRLRRIRLVQGMYVGAGLLAMGAGFLIEEDSPTTGGLLMSSGSLLFWGGLIASLAPFTDTQILPYVNTNNRLDPEHPIFVTAIPVVDFETGMAGISLTTRF